MKRRTRRSSKRSRTTQSRMIKKVEFTSAELISVIEAVEQGASHGGGSYGRECKSALEKLLSAQRGDQLIQQQGTTSGTASISQSDLVDAMIEAIEKYERVFPDEEDVHQLQMLYDIVQRGDRKAVKNLTKLRIM